MLTENTKNTIYIYIYIYGDRERERILLKLDEKEKTGNGEDTKSYDLEYRCLISRRR